MSVLLRRLVHNEAMRSDPKEIYGWRVYMLACSVSLPPSYFFLSPVFLGMARKLTLYRHALVECSSGWRLASSEVS